MLLGVDIETTGLDPRRDRIVQIGFSHRLWKHRAMVNPQRVIPPGARAVHGVSAEAVEGAPVFADVAAWVVTTFAAGDTPVAYNASFEVEMLNAELQRAAVGVRLRVRDFIDPLIWFRRIWPGERHRLSDMCDHLDVRRGGHRADDDAEAARLIVLELIRRRLIPDDVNTILQEQEQPRQRDLWRDPLPGEDR